MPLLEFGGVCEQRLVSSSHLELAVWLELPGVVTEGSSVWREGSKCQTLPAGQEVCLEATTESS